MSDTARRRGPKVALVVMWALLLLGPYQLSQFWEQTGLFAMAAIIGAIGLQILTGTRPDRLALNQCMVLFLGMGDRVERVG